MSKTVIDAQRYRHNEVLHHSGIEAESFDELYEQEIAQATIYNYHSASFYHIFRLKGEGNVHYVKNRTVVSKGDCLLIVNRDVLQRYSRRHCDGDMVLFSDVFFSVKPDKSAFLADCSLFKADYTVIPLQDEKFSQLVGIYFRLLNEFWHQHCETLADASLSVLRNYLHNLLITIEREYRYEQSLMGAFAINNELDPINQFKALLNENFTTEKQVHFYAERLGMTEQKLSTIVKSRAGLSAKEYINEKMLSESIALLDNTTLNTGEIAQKLGFDFTYFVKFFRRHYGVTPNKYRRSK